MTNISSCEIPEGYQRREGLEYDGELGRYLWSPEVDDLGFMPGCGVHRLLEQRATLPGVIAPIGCYLDGFARVEEIDSGHQFWAAHLQFRSCVPVIPIPTTEG